MTTIKPLTFRALVKLLPPEKTQGSIIIPENIDRPILTCLVLEVSERDSASKVRLGDKVLIPKGCGYEFTLDNERVLIVNQDEILAIVKESA